MFADIVGFTRLSAKGTPRETLDLLNELFTRSDRSAQRIGVEKIKTIGDAYMAVAGLPDAGSGSCATHRGFGSGSSRSRQRIPRRDRIGPLVRIGINSGPVIAGVIG